MPSTVSTSGASLQAPLRDQIHHYPARLIDTRSGTGGRRFTLRPVLPQDDLLLAELVAGLSAEARRNRFFGAVNLSLAHLRQMSNVDYRQQMGLVVTTQLHGRERVVADARYCIEAGGGNGAELALMVDERWQRQGLGQWALQSLQQAASQAGLTWLHGAVQCGNGPMLSLVQRCGFATSPDPDDDLLMKVQHRLNASSVSAPARPSGVLGWLRRAWPGPASSPTS